MSKFNQTELAVFKSTVESMMGSALTPNNLLWALEEKLSSETPDRQDKIKSLIEVIKELYPDAKPEVFQKVTPQEEQPQPLVTCSKCGTPIYNGDLFKGPHCPRCNNWC